MEISTLRLFRPLAILSFLAAASMVSAADVSGVKLEDKIVLDGKPLLLNGAGLRQANGNVKLFVVAMYQTEKKTTAAEMLAQTGPRRIYLNFQRNYQADEMGQMFIVAMNRNSSKEEKSKIVNQMTQFGEMVSSIGTPKINDTMRMDWVPGKGTLVTFNGTKLGEVPGIEFFNALQRIWIGEQVADPGVKGLLLGGQ